MLNNHVPILNVFLNLNQDICIKHIFYLFFRSYESDFQRPANQLTNAKHFFAYNSWSGEISV